MQRYSSRRSSRCAGSRTQNQFKSTTGWRKGQPEKAEETPRSDTQQCRAKPQKTVEKPQIPLYTASYK